MGSFLVAENVSSRSINIPVLPLASSSTGKTSNIPVLGFGTATYPFVGSEIVKEAILDAIRLGYRHFDTAALYQTERNLGEAISEALSLGLIESRQDLFITSKLWCSDAHPHRVLPAIRTTLKNLGLEYLDLYLIHWPASVKPGNYDFPFDKEYLLPMDFKGVWEVMEECQKLGLTKSIGISNFSCKKIQNLLATAKIPPAVNQVEMNPLWQQRKLREFCHKNGILITAYSPLGAKGTPWGSNGVMECETLKQIADAKGKTLAQVCLRWAYEQEVSFVVKSFSKERISENADIFEWELFPEEVEKINQIPQKRGFPGFEFVADHGPYNTLEELWDGEI
ncbi:putative 3''-deamino-3''-oxonicotianamine reductase [Rosa chinensis]|uniref:Putative 3''-deamino-3''-oxonicotianamine reductase n=1 Tax=Rosa chinensis TaxID=74649 RepID=A0A2P6PE30_ROSCH|nr:non-functional NADPH-dependent codeinone reductase 2 [Rosa chinensis]PRQ20183.1 putative 3''-deamino-3''-oxonicotianamine reductase [Rosa chinensis]